MPHKLLAALLCMLMFSVLIAEDVDVESEKVKEPLAVAFMDDYPPFSFTLPNGVNVGLYIEMWQLWSEYADQPIDIIVTDFSDIQQLVTDGKVIHSGIFINESRSEWADFSIPFHAVDTGIFYRQEVSAADRVLQTSTIRVGAYKDSYQIEFIEQNFTNLQPVKLESSAEGVLKLLAGEIDAFVGDVPFIISRMNQIGTDRFFYANDIIFSNTVHAAIPKGRPDLVELINDGWQKIPVQKLIELQERWIPSTPSFFKDRALIPSLNMAEQLYLSANKNLSLGVERDYQPLEFVTDDNDYSGIISDYVTSVSRKLELNFTNLTQYSWRESFELMQQGKVDVVAGVVPTAERAERMNFSKPYLSLPTAIVSGANGISSKELQDYQGQKVAIVRGFVLDNYLQKNYPELDIVGVEGHIEALEKIISGEIDAYIGTYQIINYEIEQRKYDNLNLSILNNFQYDYAFAIRKGLEPLVPIINKAIDDISVTEHQQFSNTWFSIQVTDGWTLYSVLTWVVPIGSTLIAILLFVAYSNRRLESEVLERRKVESELLVATETSERANQAKSEFLANMSHEIRTPMNAIIGMCQIMQDGELVDEQRNNLEIINSSSETLLMLINDILDLSKIESGKLEIDAIAYDLNASLEHLASQINLLINHEKVSFTIDVAENVPSHLIGDPLRLGQILLNLCNNAAKFTDDGKIALSLSIIEAKEDSVDIQFSVTDTGIGMSDEQMSRLFQTYAQADSSITRKYGGSGLGLKISKYLIEMMDGSISVTSQPEQGSTFTFNVIQTIDRQVIAQSESNNDTQTQATDVNNDYKAQLTGKRVLLVDDNKVNLMVAQTFLVKAGIRVDTAESGIDAITLAELNDYDAVLMDIQMPEMDGYAASEKIRQQPKNHNLVIIALSANVMNTDIEKSLEVGLNAHLPKPLDRERLYQTLIKFSVS